jgi:hypothetical protein
MNVQGLYDNLVAEGDTSTRIAADRIFADVPLLQVPMNFEERHEASPEARERDARFRAIRMRVEGAIRRIKTWNVAKAQFRSYNRLLHVDCISVATMLSEFVPDHLH